MVNNLGISFHVLPIVYLVSGLFTVFAGPLIGKASDRYGKFQIFFFGSVVSIVMTLIWTNLGPVSLMVVIIMNVLMFVGIFSRMIPSQALFSAIPEITKRGSFNAINASLQQFSGGIASFLAGVVIVQSAGGRILHFDRVGYIVVMTSLLSLALMYAIHKAVPERLAR
jgi:predicted MFS family arabinose efflux permease